MIALGALILVLIGALFAASLLMRWVARRSQKTRGWSAVILLLLVLPGLAQLLTGYTLATPYAPVITPLVATVACALALLLAWHWKPSKWNWIRAASALGLGVPILYLIANLRDALLVIGLTLGTSGIHPVARGHIVPGLSYYVVVDHRLWGGTAYYAYQIYRNPTWLPVIHRQVARGSLDECVSGGAGIEAADFKFALKAPIENDAINLSCVDHGSESPPMRIPIH